MTGDYFMGGEREPKQNTFTKLSKLPKLTEPQIAIETIFEFANLMARFATKPQQMQLKGEQDISFYWTKRHFSELVT